MRRFITSAGYSWNENACFQNWNLSIYPPCRTSLDLLSFSFSRLITRDPVGNIDGVESDGKGGYIVTDWMAGKVLRISPQGDVRLIRQFAQGTADHAFLPAVNVLIVPHMNENKVAAYDISDALR